MLLPREKGSDLSITVIRDSGAVNGTVVATQEMLDGDVELTVRLPGGEQVVVTVAGDAWQATGLPMRELGT